MSRIRQIIAAAATLAFLGGGVAVAVAPAVSASPVASAPSVWYHG